MTGATQGTAPPPNFRDLAGPSGYRAAGGRMRSALIYRSTAVDESVDAGWLRSLGLSDVFDLRTSKEVDAKPDRLPDGVRYAHYDVIGAVADFSVFDPSGPADVDEAKQILMDVNRLFVADESARERFGALLRAMIDADGSGPQLFHCTAGKDRTGWAALIVQRAVGVSEEDAMRDYLLTNERSASIIDAIAGRARAERGDEAGLIARALAGVFPEALQAGLDEADRRFGSFDGYLREGLGVDDSSIERLRARLVG